MSTKAVSRDTYDAVIVGAGAAGLGAARHLIAARPDMSILVLEAEPYAGGRALTVRSLRLNNEPIDLGCGWLHGASTNILTKIAEEAGRTVDRTPAPWSEGGKILNPESPDATEAQMALRSFFDRIEQRSSLEPDSILADLLEPGNRWNEHIDAIGTYINGVELNQASIADFKQYDPGHGPDWRVSEGLGALVARFGEQVPLVVDTVVSRIDHSGATKIRVETSRGTVYTHAVLLTVSTNVLASEAIQFWPTLPNKVELAANLPLGLANKIFLRLDSPDGLPKDTRLFGSFRRARTGAYQLRPFGTDLVEGYFAGQLAHDLERAGSRAAFAFATDEIAHVFGNRIRKQLEFGTMSAWGQRPLVGGSYSYALPGALMDRVKLSATIDGRLFFAGEACSPRRYSTAHGAYESGVSAATEMAKLKLPQA